MKKLKNIKGQKVQRAGKQRTLKAIVTVSVIVMFLGTIFMVIVPSGNAGAEDNIWEEKFPSSKPSARRYPAMAYDSKNNLVVLFGGYDGSAFQDTWVYSVASNTWTQKNPSTKPSARFAHSITYDSKNNKVVLFGGKDNSNNLKDETWIYDVAANTWTQKNPSTKPSPRTTPGITYDSTNGKVVLFGGYDGSKTLNDTWVYDLASDTWTQKNPSTKPSARLGLAMAYDSTNNVIFLFGGQDNNGNELNDTWVYEVISDTWTEKNPSTKPSERHTPGIAYDSTNNVFVLFGGESSSRKNDTWVYSYSSNTWTEQNPVSKPSARAIIWNGMVYNSANNKFVLFGGETNSGDADDTWLYTYKTSKLTIESSQPSYYQSENVTINTTYSNGTANITFQVKDPDDKTYLVETIETNETGFAQLEFQLYNDDTPGNYTVYATNDKDDSKDDITFEVKVLIPHLIIKLLDVPASVNRGETLNVDFTIDNTFDESKDVTLVLQLKDPNKRALRPDIEDKTIEASSIPKHTLSIDIPSDAKTGAYFLQGQMLTELPENSGYAIDYKTTSITVN